MQIMDERNKAHALWRVGWERASFRGVEFHVDTNAVESGRRAVTHEFPKKDLPYTEDMGRRAKEFTIRGYFITYPANAAGDQLRKRDYRIGRDNLIKALETESYGELIFETALEPIKAVCTRYRITEEQKTGGYCVFDMSFTEFGIPPIEERPNANAAMQAKADALRDYADRRLAIENQARIDLARRRSTTAGADIPGFSPA